MEQVIQKKHNRLFRALVVAVFFLFSSVLLFVVVIAFSKQRGATGISMVKVYEWRTEAEAKKQQERE